MIVTLDAIDATFWQVALWVGGVVVVAVVGLLSLLLALLKDIDEGLRRTQDRIASLRSRSPSWQAGEWSSTASRLAERLPHEREP